MRHDARASPDRPCGRSFRRSPSRSARGPVSPPFLPASRTDISPPGAFVLSPIPYCRTDLPSEQNPFKYVRARTQRHPSLNSHDRCHHRGGTHLRRASIPTPFVTDLGRSSASTNRARWATSPSAMLANASTDAGERFRPGFIDVHSPTRTSSGSRTVELRGQDPSRCDDRDRRQLRFERRHHCAAIAERPSKPRRRPPCRRGDRVARVRRILTHIVERNGVALNIASLVGHRHDATRRSRRSRRSPRRCRTREAECALVRDSVERGALGISSGLIYVPSRYADERELLACADRGARGAVMPR